MRGLSRVALLVVVSLPGALSGQSSSAPRDLRDALDRLARAQMIAAPLSADSVAPGARRIPPGTTVHGSVVARGPVDVAGVVDGTVVSLGGDVTIHRGGVVHGDAVAVGGRVVADSGQIDGEMRSLSALPAALPSVVATADVRTPMQRTLDAVRLVAGTFGVLLIVAIGVLLFAGRNLDEVVGTLERQFGRAFWVGLVGQLMVLPALVLLCVALAVSVIGILLIPFALVAYAIAAAGLVTLGFLAVARLVGGALWRAPEASTRTRALGGLALGVAIFFVLWIVAALLVWAPLAAAVVRAAALAATWAAMTLGLGAAILSRAGTHRRVASGGRPVELAAWQTPTPITGVVAARRPAVAAKEAR
jgi:hypothetical protein